MLRNQRALSQGVAHFKFEWFEKDCDACKFLISKDVRESALLTTKWCVSKFDHEAIRASELLSATRQQYCCAYMFDSETIRASEFMLVPKIDAYESCREDFSSSGLLNRQKFMHASCWSPKKMFGSQVVDLAFQAVCPKNNSHPRLFFRNNVAKNSCSLQKKNCALDELINLQLAHLLITKGGKNWSCYRLSSENIMRIQVVGRQISFWTLIRSVRHEFTAPNIPFAWRRLLASHVVCDAMSPWCIVTRPSLISLTRNRLFTMDGDLMGWIAVCTARWVPAGLITVGLRAVRSVLTGRLLQFSDSVPTDFFPRTFSKTRG